MGQSNSNSWYSKGWNDTSDFVSGGTSNPDFAAANPFNHLGAPRLASQPDPSASDPYTSALQASLDKKKANADQLSSDAKDFRSKLSGYEGTQISAAQDSAKSRLTGDVLTAKANANARGMAYSGLNTQGQQNAQAYEGGLLSENIQKINSDSSSQADYKDKLALDAQNGVDSSTLSYEQFKATQAQTSYQQALEDNKNKGSAWGDIFGGIAAGAVTGFVVGGPVGAAVGAGVGGAGALAATR